MHLFLLAIRFWFQLIFCIIILFHVCTIINLSLSTTTYQVVSIFEDLLIRLQVWIFFSFWCHTTNGSILRRGTLLALQSWWQWLCKNSLLTTANTNGSNVHGCYAWLCYKMYYVVKNCNDSWSSRSLGQKL